MTTNLQIDIFYTIAEILSNLNKNKADVDLINKYNNQLHQDNLDFFYDFVNKSVEKFYKKNKDVDLIIINELIFCLICLIDDLFIAEENEIRNYWTLENLEHRFYKSQSGGDVFFHNISRHIMEKNVEKNNLLFIYYLCIKSGFKGNLKNNIEKLKHIESRLYSLIEIDENVFLPTIEKEIDGKEISILSKLNFKINRNFIIINTVIFLLFLLINSIIWESKSSAILNLFNQ